MFEMFSTQHNNTVGSDSDGYDFNKSENAARWRGLFIPSLRKVLEQVNTRMGADDDALFYMETLCLRILAMLCAKPQPHTVQDVEEKVKNSFPAPIDSWALDEARETVASKKRKSVLPTDKVHSLLQKDVLQYKIDSNVSVFIVAVLEYISADVLKLTGNYVRQINHSEITKEDIEVVMCADKVLTDMFYPNNMKANVISPLPPLPAQRASTTYEEVVKDLIHDEKQYQRDLHMIIRVFREEVARVVREPKELDAIFSNIMDIYEVTVTLLGSLEDVIEMSQEQTPPCVGSCFEELAEAEEFNVYTKYAQEVTSQQSKDALTMLLNRTDAVKLKAAGHGFLDAVKYYLPKLLLVPVTHAFVYFDYVKVLMALSPSQDDIESFQQVQGLLRPLDCDLKAILKDLPKEIHVPLTSRARRVLAIERTRDLQLKVEHWDKDVGQNCNEFVREDCLGKLGSGKRIAERKVYLFDGLMVLCKANTKRQAPSTGAQPYDYRLKEKFFMRRVEINDRPDTDELKNSFEIAPRVQPPVILTAKNALHKNDWMADLIMVSTKSMLDRTLDSILLDIEKKHPLRMPSPEIYKFAVPDSPDNIVLEERESAGVPLIKGATLCKLIERLTYHIYADPMFVRTFLITYRYFCTPQNLLSLLIERFNIPDPSLVYQDCQQGADKDGLNCDTDKMHKNTQREDWKRYRKEYVQPVQFRVLNVLRHWVDHHFYDFEKDSTLLEKLEQFLASVNGKSMRKWVDSVLKIVQRKNEQEKSFKPITFSFGNIPPPIEHHLNVPDSEINLLTLHPLELARQLTLYEFELYKNVKPSELVGSPWTKKDKELNSPNLLKIMKHTTNVTRWIEKSIIEAENFEERVAIASRAIEVMMVMLELNNFNGILSISAAMGSASVHRLQFTLKGLPARYEKFLEEWAVKDGHLRKFQDRLRSINPPCVPFFGRYLTDILHFEEGNPDFLPGTELINFSKRRMVSVTIGEIQQYQNQPYCLLVDTKIRNFLENLDPFKGRSDIDISNYLYHESLRIEPRGCKQPLKFSRRWANLPLKSPGIKPRRQNNSSSSSNNNSNNSNSLAQSSSSATSTSALGTRTLPMGGEMLTGGASGGEQSPTSSSGGLAVNPQAYSVFANVNIPDRNETQNSSLAAASVIGVSTSSAVAASGATCGMGPAPGTGACHVITDKADKFSNDGETAGSPVPQLPKKPNAMGGDTAMGSNCGYNSDKSPFSPIFSDTAAPTRLDRVWNLPDEMYAGQQPQVVYANNNSIASDGTISGTGEPFVSPLVRVVISPRHDSLHSTGNRSPFQNAPYGSKSSTGTTPNFSPTERVSSQMTVMDSSIPPVPVSPHVNVPAPSEVEYRTVPPPLPPRRKERTESCADLAQKRQAPDAPTLPPRDGELSPPPIPPRLNHSAVGTCRRSQTNEFMGSNNLLLPNTSSIMIRRNSAIEKRSANSSNAAGATATTATNITPSSSASTSASGSSSSSLKTPSNKSSLSQVQAGHLNPGGVITPVSSWDDQAISPALSSSTTTSPLTPISPHIPAGCQIPEMQSPSCSSSYQPITRYKPASVSSCSSTSSIAPLLSQPYRIESFLPNISGGVGANIPSRSSPKQCFTAAEGTPKLPPKPSLSGNFYNTDKGTMFLYPSTNQE